MTYAEPPIDNTKAIQRQLNPVHILAIYFPKILFSIIKFHSFFLSFKVASFPKTFHRGIFVGVSRCSLALLIPLGTEM